MTTPALRMEVRDLVLPDGHRVGVAACGEGVPFVMIHALGGEGMVYARTLTRIARLGYRVIAVDSAGHGRTAGLGGGGWRWEPYVDLHRRVLDALDLDAAVLAGHSMGGKLAVDLAARDPGRALAVLAINAPIGQIYDTATTVFRRLPPLLPIGAALLAADIGSAALRSRRETITNAALSQQRLARRLALAGNVPGAFAATISDGTSTARLRTLRDHAVATVVIHGDLAVWYRTARAAAHSADATLVRVHGAGHIWLLEDPDTLAGIVAGLAADGVLPLGTGRDPAGIDDLPAARHRWSIDRRPNSRSPIASAAS